MIGKKLRIHDIMDANDRALIVELDAGLYGLNLSNIKDTLEKLPLELIDAIILSPGKATKLCDFFTRKLGPSLIVRCDWTNAHWDDKFILAKERVRHIITCPADSGSRIGASALVGSLFVGGEHDEDDCINLNNLCIVVRSCIDFGLPFLVECLPQGPRITIDNFADAAEMAARVMIEIGADMVAAPSLGSEKKWADFVGCCEDKPLFYVEKRQSGVDFQVLDRELEFHLKGSGNGLIINGFIPNLHKNIQLLAKKIHKK